MANLIQQRQKERLAEAIAENPYIARGKKLCGILALIWALARVLHLTVELILVFKVDASIFSPVNIFAMVMVLLSSIAVYNGAKGFVILPIFGGVMMLSQVFTTRLYEMLGADYIPLARVYALVFIIASLVQVIFPICLLVARSSKEYLNTMQRISKEVTAEFRK